MSVTITETNQAAGGYEYHFNNNITSGNSVCEIEEENSTEVFEINEAAGGYEYHFNNNITSGNSVCEIEEENSTEVFEINDALPLASIREEFEGSLFSFDVHGGENEDSIYVAVGKSESSMDALSWTLHNLLNLSTIIYLIHVFPEIKHIPSPLGMLPKSRVSPEQVETYMTQERGKRRELLQKFFDACSASQVRVDTMLIESDDVPKAIVDLIPILNIRKLVVGTSKSSPRKSKSRRGSGIADQILQSAPETCEIKIVCEGKEVIDQIVDSPSPRGNDQSPEARTEENESNDSFSCMCFKSKFI